MKTTSRLELIARIARRVFVFAAPLSLVLSGAGVSRAQSRTAPAPNASSQATSFASLPRAAQSAISTAIGRDQSDYHAVPTGSGGFRMLNPGRRLSAEFDKNEVVMRVGAAGGTDWGLALKRYGRGESIDLVSSVRPQANANRVEYHHGGLIEWYVNSPLGIEQGFTLTKPPARGGRLAGQPLTIAMGLSGDLTASVDSAGTGLTLKQSDGQAVLSYTGLAAQDAGGKPLRCWLELNGSQLLLRINDAGARYPIFVDPWMQAAELTNASGGESDVFGHSVAVSGNTLVVGAPYDRLGTSEPLGQGQGALYVFVEPASGGWAAMTSTPTAVLTASDGMTLDGLGYSVAISEDGTTIVAGAPGATVNHNQYEGAAYVFVEPTAGGVTSWSLATKPQHEAAKLTAPDGVPSQNFGYSVGVDENGNTIVVSSIGPAYVFTEPTLSGVTSWSKANNPQIVPAELTNSGVGLNPVGISGDGSTIVGVETGEAYVFVEQGSTWATTSTSTASLKASGGGTLYGPVAISGGTVVIGGYNGAMSVVYVFTEPMGGGATSWSLATSPQNEAAVLSPANPTCANFFGSAVGINESGDTIVAGAGGVGVVYIPGCIIPPTPPTSQQGAVYVFDEPIVGGALAWTGSVNETAELTASDATNGELLGYSVGISGNTIAAGAPSKTVGSNPFQGTAYVFTQPSTGPYAQYTNSCSQCNSGGPLDFGAVNVNTTGTQTVTLTNPPGSSAFNFTGVSLQQGTSFTITSVACSNGSTITTGFSSISVTLAVGDSCTITLQFAPLVNGNGYGDLLVIGTTIPNSSPLAAPNSNASAAPPGTLGQAMLLIGDAVAPYASFSNTTAGSPTQVTFGNVAENAIATQTLTLANTGTGPLILGGTDVPGPAVAFSYTQVECGSTLEPLPLPVPFTINAGVSCAFTMQFKPNALGLIQGGINFIDNAGAGESNLPGIGDTPYFLQNVMLSGTGISSIATTTTITSTSCSAVVNSVSYPLPVPFALVNTPQIPAPCTVNVAVALASGGSTPIPTGTVIVEDGLDEFCQEAINLTSANKGKGSCTLFINGLGSGSTPLFAQYTPDATSITAGLGGSNTNTNATTFTEDIVQITNCGTPPSIQLGTQGTTTTLTITACLSGDINALPTAMVPDCPQQATCNITVTQLQPGLYQVVLGVTPGGAGRGAPLNDRRPWVQPMPFTLLGFGIFLAMLMALQLARRKRPRLRLAYAAGLVFAMAMLLGGLNGCANHVGSSIDVQTPPGTYVIHVTIAAGKFSVVVPVTLNVTN